MLDFWEFNQDIELQRIINEGVEDHQPTDGRWDSPLEQGTHGAVYRFNVAGDQCGSQARPCYQVNVSGSPASGVSISFSRQGSYSDEHRGVGMEVFKGVLKALSEYIHTLKPAKLHWSPVTKSVPHPVTGKITNPEARAHVYEAWALRHLFPEKYIGMSGQWLRRDIYDREYVPNGYPPVPEGLTDSSHPTEKRKALEEMQTKARQNQEEIHRRERERREEEERRQREEERRRQEEIRRQREEAERRRQEIMNQRIQDPELNPNGIKEGDVVYIVDPHPSDDWRMENRLGQVTGFQFGSYRYGGSDESEPLHAIVKFTSDEEDNGDEGFYGQTGYIALHRLKKESPEGRAERERRKQERIAAALASPEKNPHGVQKGDEIVSWMAENPGSKQNGLRGKIREIEVDRNNNVSAKVDWTPEAVEVLQATSYRDVSELSVGVTNLRKATPEVLDEIRRKMREHEIEQRVTSGRERWQSRTRRAQEEEPEQPEELGTAPEDDLTNHPGNPLHLKVGDLVKLRNPPQWGRQSRRSHFNGVLVRLEKPYWGNSESLTGYIKFHGSNAQPYRVWNVANEIDRDESEETRNFMAQQQTRRQRAQRTASSTGGHNIGDTVTVVNGRHRGKSGRIVNFRSSGANMNAVIAPMDGDDFSVNVNMLQPPATTPPPAAESFSFRDYLMYFESRINRGLAS